MKLRFYTLTDGILDFEVDKSSVLVGRGSSCDVILKVEGISRQHCRIEAINPEQFLITDLGSTNGVLVNNERIPINEPTPYATYLTLSIGSIPQVTLEASVIVKDEKVSSQLKPKKIRPLNIELDLPQKNKKAARPTRVSDDEIKVTSAVPWRLVTLSLLVLVALTYYFVFAS